MNSENECNSVFIKSNVSDSIIKKEDNQTDVIDIETKIKEEVKSDKKILNKEVIEEKCYFNYDCEENKKESVDNYANIIDKNEHLNKEESKNNSQQIIDVSNLHKTIKFDENKISKVLKFDESLDNHEINNDIVKVKSCSILKNSINIDSTKSHSYKNYSNYNSPAKSKNKTKTTDNIVAEKMNYNSSEESLNELDDFENSINLQELNCKPNYTIKCIILGDSGIGKTCFAIRSVKNMFVNDQINTIGFGFFHTHFKIKNKIAKIQIWDTCGQELYKNIVSSFYRDSDIALICFDISNKSTFSSIDYWVNDIKSNCKSTMLYIVGLKSDLKHEVEIHEIKRYIAENKEIVGFSIVSSLEGTNCKETLFKACRSYFEKNYNKFINHGSFEAKRQTSGIKLNNEDNRCYSCKC